MVFLIIFVSYLCIKSYKKITYKPQTLGINEKRIIISQTSTLTPTLTPTITITPAPSPTIEPTILPEPSLTPTNIPSPALSTTPIPELLQVTNDQLDKWFTDYSNHFSIDRSMLYKIAVCESKLNPNAKNGDYGGLFQFTESTWQSTRRVMNLDPNPDLRFNPEEAIKTASFKISTDGTFPWKNCAN